VLLFGGVTVSVNAPDNLSSLSSCTVYLPSTVAIAVFSTSLPVGDEINQLLNV
jgi:hypothetical protein